TIDAATAHAWGLVNRVVPIDELDAATLELITRATRGSILSKAMGKQGFYGEIDLPQSRAYEFAIELMASAALTADAQEGFAAFLAKRHADFTQRP
ncbi:MAG: enoyl-CoA hydratase-related protein, partial [Ilumatobacteraceae bacterium]